MGYSSSDSDAKEGFDIDIAVRLEHLREDEESLTLGGVIYVNALQSGLLTDVLREKGI